MASNLLRTLCLALLCAVLSGAAAAQEAPSPAPEQIADALCLACHQDSVTEPAWKASPHSVKAGFTCQGVCHANVTSIQHTGQALPALACLSCHPTWQAREQQMAASVHGPLGLTACARCHDPHTATTMKLEPAQVTGACTSCHLATGLADKHGFLVRPEVHILRVPCGGCHGDVHDIKAGATEHRPCSVCHDDRAALAAAYAELHAWPDNSLLHLEILDCSECHRKDGWVKSCTDCHGQDSILSRQPAEGGLVTFSDPDMVERYGYVLGATHVKLVDWLGLCCVFGALAVALGHATLRILTRGRRA